ncbi:hypothetical protein EV645_3335 [Kribbella rubisoli]|uniref:Uncharacterized protein n=1 Tax=Kribbella rubisoli TaxID=3075929 RepID=A0A4Q7WYZ5_9ACTN|nr:hypothetical protein [Kribbella rubisoli]RZU15797.1 hypothetical protein EV645_3335 [Kribbella rubisoli]
MECTASPAGLLFECLDGCGRRVVVDGVSGELTIVDHGDRTALHQGSNGGVKLTATNVD